MRVSRNGTHGPLGVEQGFVLDKAPACTGSKTITMAVEGDLAAMLDDADGDGRGDEVRFVDDAGHTALTYLNLFVTDAMGHPVPAWMSVTAGEVSIVVDDATAEYPLAIDPLIWVEQPKLMASDGATEDRFGSAIALDGDTAIVGAHLDDIGGTMMQGSAYVFTRTGGVWTQQQKLTANDPIAGAAFGETVALEGDTALLGAPSLASKSVYVFTRTGGVWTRNRNSLSVKVYLGGRSRSRGTRRLSGLQQPRLARTCTRVQCTCSRAPVACGPSSRNSRLAMAKSTTVSAIK